MQLKSDELYVAPAIMPTPSHIKKIHHISDIQIRLIKRHTEYREVFKRTYDSIKKNAEDSIIVVSGDIVHTKTELSPELVLMTSDFLNDLANIAFTIVIPGNHDCNLNNESRMDSLYPIIKMSKNKNLFYSKKSEVIQCGNLIISIMGIFDDKTLYHTADTLPTDLTRVAIYHGTLTRSITDLGYEFMDGDLDSVFFDGFDMVLLGDIHKMQRLQEYDKSKKKPEIWYAGSLIQQNHGESLHHGFLEWDTETKIPKFVKVRNDYGYYTVIINNGQVNDLSDLPAKPRLRVQITNTDSADVKRIIADIHKKAKVQEISTSRFDKLSSSVIQRGSGLSIGDIRNVEYQNDLILDYLKRNRSIGDEIVQRIKKLNSSINGKLKPYDVQSNTIWKANRFEFSNMFSYGEGNYINLSDATGTIGIFAPNASGKSSILDSLSFTLFDKSSRAFKASQILNNKKDDFVCKFSFIIDDTKYFIERKASKRKYTNQIKVDVDFWYEDEFGEKHSLNGEERRNTDEIISSYIGNYEDFILTALSVQNANSGFIDMGQSDRKDLMGKFLGINVFEELYVIASEEIKEVQTLIKEFQKQDFASQLAHAEMDYDSGRGALDILVGKQKIIATERDVLNAKIIELAKKLVKIDESILDIDALIQVKSEIESQLKDIEEHLQKYERYTAENKQKYLDIQTRLSGYNEADIIVQYDELTRFEHIRDEKLEQVERLKIDVGHKLDKLANLQKHEYDPNCKYCMNNVFVKDAIRTKEELKLDKTHVEVIIAEIEALQAEILNKFQYRSLYIELHDLQSKLETIKMNQLSVNAKQSEKLNWLDNANAELKLTEDKIKRHAEVKDIVKNNLETEAEMKKFRDEYDAIMESLDILNDKIQTVYGKIEIARTAMESIHEAMKKVKELEVEMEAYEYYLEVVNRDGIPYELISKIIPEIEQEVNNILHQMVDFNIVWQLDGKNINTFITYDDDNVWPLELSSGMERFISSTAIRTALINVSSLPRPNFLAVDEGFGVLDAENINSLHLLMDYLRTRFDFILIISHLDLMKDLVDTTIDIKRDDEGFSIVQYE